MFNGMFGNGVNDWLNNFNQAFTPAAGHYHYHYHYHYYHYYQHHHFHHHHHHHHHHRHHHHHHHYHHHHYHYHHYHHHHYHHYHHYHPHHHHHYHHYYHYHHHHHHYHIIIANQQQSTAPPPASYNFVKSLQYVNVTADDLLEESNKECCVCLEAQTIGSQAYKLPCGHLYHPACLLDWIKRHCTCPCCRFELPTDDSSFEQERKIRMRSRKRRYRLDELKKMKVSQLKEIGRELQIGIGDCLDKDDIISKYVKSGKIDITENAPLIQFTYEQFNSKGVGELRKLLLSFGISDDDAIEKSELRNRLLESGRVSIVSDNEEIFNEKDDEKNEKTVDEHKIEDTKPGTKRSNSYGDNDDHSSKARTFYTVDKLKNTSIHELKQIANLLNISIIGCYDKDEVVNNIITSGKVEISSDIQPNQPNNTSTNGYDRNNSEILTLTLELVKSLSIREIKDIMNNLQISSSGCTEKEDLIEAIKKPQYHNKIRIID